MIEEKDIRAIYDGFYKLAEKIGDSQYTHDLSYDIHLMIGNNIARKISGLDRENNSQELWNLRVIMNGLDDEYHKRFEKLETNQRTPEVKAK